jgi:NAD(P)-dependent dehydrogenase (short-subunit alcohol dehydrogenase family)
MLKGKKALVTGAARGIGLGIAQVLAAAGAELLLHCRSESPELHALGAPFVKADLGCPEGVATLFAEVERRWGRLDVAVNNAGWDPGDLPWQDIDEALYEKLSGINIRGTLFCCLREMKLMPEGGSIINIGSVQMNSTVPGRVLYATSKGAIHSMTGALALEGGPLGIRVNNIAPGYIEVDRMRSAPGFDAAQIAKGIPLQRLGKPEDVGDLVVFLASDASSFLTGQSIVLDGGVERKLARSSL